MSTPSTAFTNPDIAGVGEVDNLRASVAADNMLVRNRVNVDAHQQQDQLVRILNQARADTSSSAWRNLVDPTTGLENADKWLNDANAHQPVLPLPMDSKPVAAPQAHSRTDFVPLHSHLMLVTCVCYGLNPELVGLHHHGGVQSAETMARANAVTDNTVNAFRIVLAQAFKDLYELIWGGEEKRVDVHVTFPSLLDWATVRLLYQEGTLTHKAYRLLVANRLDMTIESFEAQRPTVE